MQGLATELSSGLWRSNLDVTFDEAKRLVAVVRSGPRAVALAQHPLRNSKMSPARLAGLAAALDHLSSADGFVKWQELASVIRNDGLLELRENRSVVLRSMLVHAPVYVWKKPGRAATEGDTLIAARLPDADAVLMSVVDAMRALESTRAGDLRRKLDNLQLDSMLRVASRPRDRQLVRAVVAKLVGPTLAASAGMGSESGSRRETFRRAMDRVDQSLTSMPEIEERTTAEMDEARRAALERAAAADDLANKYESLGRANWQTKMSEHADAQRKLAESLSLHSARGVLNLRKRIAKALTIVRRVVPSVVPRRRVVPSVVSHRRATVHLSVACLTSCVLLHLSVAYCSQAKLSIDHRDRGRPAPYLIVYNDLKEKVAALSALTGARADPHRRSLELQLIDKVTYEWISKKLASNDLAGEPIVVSRSWLNKHKIELAITSRKIAKIDLPSEVRAARRAQRTS